ncbi:MAG: glycoside hydrolase family 127 protein [Candidatus Caldatribacterium sp.]|uniref:glycoside hydrolase family 127 protein n=1 Tax=Candidatus Caldatribacterium sp. TaxID=2282143 RepID=UPI002991F14C|nr:glycoside hydrolase family 127 protein [Candidatus Caldatribacterium sp.]MCX7730015.1 glycoside hydrolase family 127 protein [Candidatus Caldatribacterium sp.]MDW8081118.1 glycoside hydrolase family 127 protein [Candidatus Calescibacterium sp.]
MNVRVDEESFWGRRIRQVKEVILPYQWKALNDEVPGAPKSHAFANFRIAAGLEKGTFYGFVFQDSDVAKWLEAASHCLRYYPDAELERLLDEVIEVIALAQREDGYLNTYFTIKDPQGRWTNLRDNHELYCAGHLIEAAVAHYQATGKGKLLDIAKRLADHIEARFGDGPTKRRGYCGHPEVELALVKLYRATGERKYLDLAAFFVNERGRKPLYFELEAQERGEEKPAWPFWTPEYCQAHLPVREQQEAVGHAVRAMYLYSAMADLALELQDKTLLEACRTLWESVTRKRMYITGGIGSSAEGEAFTFDYDLPPDRAYTETCASIGLVFFAQRMLRLEERGEYGDVLERALYNGVLSGISLDGTKYFYVNPLEVFPEAVQKRYDLRHVVLLRQPWFSCACCPPNIARLFASLPDYVYSQDGDCLSVHLFVASTLQTDLRGKSISLVQETDYPWGEEVRLQVLPEEPLEFTVAVRIPGWCRQPRLSVNGTELNLSPYLSQGYARVKRRWERGDILELFLPMPVERVRANPAVRDAAGKVALQRGPLVFCLEEVDNGANLASIVLPEDTVLSATFVPDLLGGVVVLSGEALRESGSSPGLYSFVRPQRRVVLLRAIPYYAWNNRGVGEMTVWIREE